MNHFVPLLSLLPSLQEFEDFIAKFGDSSGFVLVALGSMVSIFQSQEVLKEMNNAFALLSQRVIWKCNPSLWPKGIKLAIKLASSLPRAAQVCFSLLIYVCLGPIKAMTFNWAIREKKMLTGKIQVPRRQE